MAVTNGWGQGVINNTNGWGKLATNSIDAGSVYQDSASGDTALIGTSAAFSYSASSYTQADADPTPTITGTTGGTFSGTSGLVFVSTSTGEIDLSASTIAAHVVTYTVGGVSSNFNLSVTAAPFSNVYSMAFDGVDDYIDCGAATYLDGLTTATISLWVQPLTTGITDVIRRGNTSSSDIRIWIYPSSDRIDFGIGSSICRTTTTTLNVGTWYHIYACYDKDLNNGKDMILFVDGVEQAATNTNATIATGTEDLIIGENFYSSNCKVDEVALWTTDQRAEVSTVYNSGVPNNLDDLTTPPTAWYRMGENGVYKSPQWLLPENSNKDKFSNFSFEFDGVGDVLVGPDANLSEAVTQASWSAWINIASTPSNKHWFYSRRGANDNYGEGLGVDGSEQLYISIGQNNSSRGIATGSTTLSLNTWYNVVVTYDGSQSTNDDKVKVYLNGSLETLSWNGTVQTELLESMGVGRTYSIGLGGNKPFTGKIDEVAVWYGTTLTSANATTIYNSGVPADLTPLSPNFMYIRMGENATFSTNWTVPDTVNSPTNDFTSSNMTIEDRVGDAPNSSNNSLSYNMDEVDRETDVPS